MARNTEAVCRMCRREGIKLYLKGLRCDSDKCALSESRGGERNDKIKMRHPRPAPGVHGARRGKVTDYGLHLREKQKVKNFYGVLERQFRQYFKMAERMKTNTGDALMMLLESRLDNVVSRLGFAASRSQARQLVRHGHILVNGRRMSIPSYLVRPGDEIAVKTANAKLVEQAKITLVECQKYIPDFLGLGDGKDPVGHVLRKPGMDDCSVPDLKIQLILELCSK